MFILKKFGQISLLVVITLCFSASAFAAPNRNLTNTGQYTSLFIPVQILGINDFHGQLNTTSQISGNNVGRADYLAAYLKQREKENKNTIIVHAGDSVGASAPVSSLLQDEPTIEFMNMTGFDVGVPGNHEFDEGPDEMMRLLNGGYHDATGDFEGADFPYVSANIVYTETGENILPSYVIKKVNGIPIAFIGVTLSETPRITTPSGVAGLKFGDEIDAVNKAVGKLKKDKIKSIIVLAHVDGFYDQDAKEVSGKLDNLAKSIDDEVDVIIAGHSHAGINNIVDGKLIVESYSNGMAFSDIDLKIDPRTKDIIAKKAEIITTFQKGIKPDAKVNQLISRYEKIVEPIANTTIATAKSAIIKNQNESGESALGNLIADAQRWEMGTDFAFTNPGGIRANIEEGEVTWEDLYRVQPFNNDLVKMTLTGAQINSLLNQQFTVNRILQISGLKYTWKDGAVVDIFLTDGITPIDPLANYTITVNSYLASGGDGFTKLKEGTNKEIGTTDLNGLINYLKKLPQPFNASIEGRINKLL
ncbi:Endonuclease YhcR precursor [Sporotomaculum syntrophicum]|uniref:Endonuclease YhcR n=1 Tax=Sporotomaculum syntrophicum TaxID=182264 RepID=A0A9D2WNR3_9FIRM|nr:bifunctional metallophosphatase/5'-nucleotidase [Sporotomaculum syntrophicum]KAF1084795.1 Endonuclease YhcR precursor [Sporotomaculum syntrophicum]